MKEIVIVTTKPDQGTAEYGIRDTETGEWILHGVVIQIPEAELPTTDRAKLRASRTMILARATADAGARGLIDPA